MSPLEKSDRFVLSSANLLLPSQSQMEGHPSVPAQTERLPAIIDTLKAIHSPALTRESIHVIGLQEVQVTEDLHNGYAIKRALESGAGRWAQIWKDHSRGSLGEHIGAISSYQPDSAEPLELDQNRFAIILRFGKVCIAITHMIYSDTSRRAKQFQALTEYMEQEELAVVMGDFNCEPHLFSPRRELGRIGLTSAFVKDRKSSPVTLPAPGYEQYRSRLARTGFKLLGGGVKFDDIYVSHNINVHHTGVTNSASDHRFVFASVSTPPGSYMDRPIT